MFSTFNKPNTVTTPKSRAAPYSAANTRPSKPPQFYSHIDSSPNDKYAKLQIRQLNLTSLPSEIHYRITEFLLPSLSSTGSLSAPEVESIPSISPSWIDSGKDANHFARSCKIIYFGVRSLLNEGKHFGIRIRKGRVAYGPAGGLLERLACIRGMEGAFERVLIEEEEEEEVPQRITRSFARIKVVKGRSSLATTSSNLKDQVIRISRFGTYKIEAHRIRHFFIHMTLPNLSTGSVWKCDDILAEAINKMSGLISFSYVGVSEEMTTSIVPWLFTTLGPLTTIALSQSKILKKLYLCGVRIRYESLIFLPGIFNPALSNPKISRESFPHFNSISLDSIILAACDDSCLDLFRGMKFVKEVKIWRNFLVEYSDQKDWWGECVWGSVEEVEFVGLAGRNGIDWLRSWVMTIESARLLNVDTVFPLRTLCLPDIFTLQAITIILESCSHFPNLTNLTFLLWRDDFNPNIFSLIGKHISHLEELTIVLDNEASMICWPLKDITSILANHLSKLKNLRKLTWNRSFLFDDAPFEKFRKEATDSISSMTLFNSKIQSVHWIGIQPHLIKKSLIGGEGYTWIWSDDKYEEE